MFNDAIFVLDDRMSYLRRQCSLACPFGACFTMYNLISMVMVFIFFNALLLEALALCFAAIITDKWFRRRSENHCVNAHYK